ncbi:MAG: glycosyltransferase [Bacteroidia bacterium]|nr:glycosyltransferase [Bacteroidia bacterium]
MIRFNVLMLGWEYPPAVNGGLGVATQGLAEALAGYADIVLMTPRAAEGRPGLFAVPLEGRPLRQQAPVMRPVARMREVWEEWTAVEERMLEVELGGYEPLTALLPVRTEHRYQVPVEVEETAWVEETAGPEHPVFRLPELYGPDLPERLLEYTQLAMQAAEALQFDVIHAHDWMTWPAALEIAAASGKPCVLHVHSLDYDRSGAEHAGFVRLLEQKALQLADRVVAVSRYTAGILSSVYGIGADRIRVVHNGIAPLEPFRLQAEFPEPLVSFVGRLTGQKGPEWFIQAARRVLERLPQVRFALAGNGDQADPLIRLAARAGIGRRVHFTGFLDPPAVRELLAMSSLFVMPSVSEPFGLSALEAAQMGVPCLISEQAGVAEALPHALRVLPQDPDAVAEQIIALLQDGALREAVVQGQLTDLQEYSWDRAARRMAGLYAEVIADQVWA